MGAATPRSLANMTIAFTFPGQGSQKPGMGRPWVDHESWELVDEASEAAGRDLAASAARCRAPTS